LRGARSVALSFLGWHVSSCPCIMLHDGTLLHLERQRVNPLIRVREISDTNGQSCYSGRNARITSLSSSSIRREPRSLGMVEAGTARCPESLDCEKGDAVKCGWLRPPAFFSATPEVASDLPLARRRRSWTASDAGRDKTDVRTACSAMESIV